MNSEIWLAINGGRLLGVAKAMDRNHAVEILERSIDQDFVVDKLKNHTAMFSDNCSERYNIFNGCFSTTLYAPTREATWHVRIDNGSWKPYRPGNYNRRQRDISRAPACMG